MYHIYILFCRDHTFYTGHTGYLKQRLTQHQAGEVSATKNKRPLKFVYFENFKTKLEATKRERQIKGWSKQNKINLIKFGHPTKIDKK